MKTSKAQQDQTRARIVRCAVDLIVAQGYEAVTMKDIARAAQIGDATIYKYFPTKERLVLGFFDQVALQAVGHAESAADFEDYDLQSRLQRLTDAVLELLAPDRPFVLLARGLLARSPLLLLGDQLGAKQTLKEAVAGYLQTAVERAEVPPSDFIRPLAGLYVDFCVGVVAYWLQDGSPQGAHTTRLVDEVLGVLVAMLRAGLPDRLVQLAGFLLRSQFARVMAAVAVPPAAPAAEDAAPAATRRRGRAR